MPIMNGIEACQKIRSCLNYQEFEQVDQDRKVKNFSDSSIPYAPFCSDDKLDQHENQRLPVIVALTAETDPDIL